MTGIPIERSRHFPEYGPYDDDMIREALLTNDRVRSSMIIEEPEHYFEIARSFRQEQNVNHMAEEERRSSTSFSDFWRGKLAKLIGR